MKRFTILRLLQYIFLGSLLFTASCGKEKSSTATNEEEMAVSSLSAQSDAEAESTFNELFDDVMGVNNDVGIAGSGVFFGRTDTLVPVTRCFTLTITRPNNTPFPVHVVVDFGTTGCTGPDGHVRKGKMIIDYTNRLIYPGAVATTRFENFYIDNNHVEGVHTIRSMTVVNPTVIPSYRIEVVNGKITRPNGNYTEWNSVRTVTQIEGISTLDFPRDDVYRIEGSGNGLVRTSTIAVRWESTITEPLIRRFTCRWIVRGRVRTVRANLPNPGNSPWVGILDFGIGLCDNQASLTVNGITRQITLP